MGFLDRFRASLRKGEVKPSGGNPAPAQSTGAAEFREAPESAWLPVRGSDNVWAVAYLDGDAGLPPVFLVRFRPGGAGPVKEYRYLDVPRAVFDEFLAASSKGRFVSGRLTGSYRASGPYHPAP